MEVEKITACIKESLSERRYRHSLGVAEEAGKLAVRYGENAEKAYMAGLVHDCAKEIPGIDAIRLLKEKYNVSPDEMSAREPRLLHGLLGAYMAESELGISDADILDAVRYHTTGKAEMSLFTKIIYIADYIEPNRDYKDVEMLREMTYKDIDEAILFALDYTIQDLIKKGKTIHPDTLHCRNDILIKKG